MIGWKSRRPRTIRDVKLSFAGTLLLTEESLVVRHILLGRRLSVSVQTRDMASMGPLAGGEGLLEVVFHRARLSRLMKFLVKGAPGNRFLLNLESNRREMLEMAEALLSPERHRKTSSARDRVGRKAESPMEEES